MTKKRLTFNIEESLHNRLKAEAAALGIPLGSHCTAILEGEGEKLPEPSIEELDLNSIQSMSLQTLRELSVSLSEKKPSDWRSNLTKVNTEIRRRYRI